MTRTHLTAFKQKMLRRPNEFWHFLFLYTTPLEILQEISLKTVTPIQSGPIYRF